MVSNWVVLFPGEYAGILFSKVNRTIPVISNSCKNNMVKKLHWTKGQDTWKYIVVYFKLIMKPVVGDVPKSEFSVGFTGLHF